jgi:hypothetical protein
MSESPLSFSFQLKPIFPTNLYSEEDYFLFDEMPSDKENISLYDERFNGSKYTN